MTPLPRTVLMFLTLSVSCDFGQTAALQGNLPKAAAPAQPVERTALMRGRALVNDFYALRVESLWQAFALDVREQWGSLTAFRTYRRVGATTYGAETQVIRERVFSDRGVTYYVRTAKFERGPHTLWNIVVGFDARGRVAVFAIAAQEEAESDRVA
ncbi:hypothetical protein [Deinococcus hohokamensis]|uniref:DUF3887 domain-containing protein n=1 Tax=Deinococcus hohokamensis TaxID=309883 RepID=A0ABV9ICP9_9DEIO